MTRSSYLTHEIPGTGGVLKQRPEDFRVCEIPDWQPSGRGEHLVLKIRKRGMTTHAAVAKLARLAKVPERAIGFAGIKDARAVTEQWISLPVEAGTKLRDADVAPLEILERALHRTKLKPGQLAGNRFDILLRDVHCDAPSLARESLAVLARRGAPNYFGPQRFGTKGDSDRIGRSLLHGDFEQAARWFLGAPSPLEGDARIRNARETFEQGRLEEALESYPAWMRNERRALETLIRHGDLERALATIPKSLRLLFVSAYQSRLFNRILDSRLHTIDQRIPGDVVVEHATGIARRSTGDAAERQRLEAFEISPAGPLFGPGLLQAADEAAAIEQSVFDDEHLHPWADATPFRDLHLRGERRPYRFAVAEAQVEHSSAGLQLSFRLPAGCYATAVLAEVMKEGACRP